MARYRWQEHFLDPDFYSETANDDVKNWCHGTDHGDGDVGTPGLDNDEC